MTDAFIRRPCEGKGHTQGTCPCDNGDSDWNVDAEECHQPPETRKRQGGTIPNIPLRVHGPTGN